VAPLDNLEDCMHQMARGGEVMKILVNCGE
jgi:hypothetical protein